MGEDGMTSEEGKADLKNFPSVLKPYEKDLREIIEAVETYNPKASTSEIIEAAKFSVEHHGDQKRLSGEPYFIHPLAVTKILTRLHLDTPSLMAGLLHDTIEDTDASAEEMQRKFGDEVWMLVDGVTKLSKVSFKSKHERQAENFRKMLLAMAQDVRVILIKLADRLHNMRTIKSMPEMKQIDIANETLEIYAPLANRLGISWLKMELEDLCLKVLKPEIYHKIESKLQSSKKEREKYIEKVIGIVKSEMAKTGIKFDIFGRTKHYYSIYRKMETRKLDFEQIYDILAFRIIVTKVSECYETLGLLHSLWKPIPGRFKDYIAIPKENMYQSLHTTVIGPDGERAEFQIRTREMNRLAEEGIAAHWLYKEGGRIDERDFKKFHWLRRMLDWQKDLRDPTEFYETLKIDLFANEVYVFTPRGEVVEFPRGATPLDFAYRIHSEIGHHCVGAKVNGRIVPLNYQLQNGDVVEILTSDKQRPRKDWLKIVITSKAKSKIRSVIKQAEREEGRKVGREILESELKKRGISINKLIKNGGVAANLPNSRYKTDDELFLAIGYGKLSASSVAAEIAGEEDKEKTKRAAPGILEQILQKVTGRHTSAIKVGNQDDILVRFARCCNPLPGDPIVGFVSRGRGVSIHRTDCPRVLEIDPERKVEVAWDTSKKAPARKAKVNVLTIDAPGILAEISRTIGHKGGNISNANIRTTRDKKAICVFEILIHDVEQLYSIMKAIEKIKGVISVERARS